MEHVPNRSAWNNQIEALLAMLQQAQAGAAAGRPGGVSAEGSGGDGADFWPSSSSDPSSTASFSDSSSAAGSGSFSPVDREMAWQEFRSSGQQVRGGGALMGAGPF